MSARYEAVFQDREYGQPQGYWVVRREPKRFLRWTYERRRWVAFLQSNSRIPRDHVEAGMDALKIAEILQKYEDHWS